MTPKITMTCLYALATVLGFIGNRQWSFSHKGHITKSAMRYFLVYLFGYGLNLAVLIYFVDILGYQHIWVQALAIPVVAVFLFLGLRYFVFKLKYEVASFQ